MYANIRLIYERIRNYGRKNPLPAAQEEVVRDDRERRGKNNNADAVVEWNNGKQWVVDFKCMQGNGAKIIDRLNDAYKQADYAIIKMIEPLSPVFIERTIRWFKQREKMKGVMIYCDGKEILQIERK